MKTNSYKNSHFSLVFNLLFILLQLPYTIGRFIYLIINPIIYIFRKIIQGFKQSVLFFISIISAVSTFIVSVVKNCVLFVRFIFIKIIFTVIKTVSFITNCITLAGSSIHSFFSNFSYQQLIATALFLSSIAVVAAVTFFSLTHIENQQYPTNISDFSFQQPLRIYDSNQYLLYEAYAHPSKDFIAPSDIPNIFSKSVVALEDPEFYSHHGITFQFVWDSFKERLLLIPTEEKTSLTQQLAENSLGRDTASFSDFVQELILTFQLEKRYSKDELLAMYLSIKTFGPEVGAEQASNRLFNTPLHQLSDQESLLLATIINTEPLNEITIDATVEKKYQETISALKKQHTFSDTFFKKNNNVPSYSPQLRTTDSNAVRLIFNEATSQLPEKYHIRNGLTIYATINLSFQNEIQRVLIEQFPHSEVVTPQATLLLVDAKTGSIKALTGYSNNLDTVQQLLETTQQLQQQADASVTEHSVDHITTPQGSVITLAPKPNTVDTNQVRAQEAIASAVTANTIIAGWVLDNDTKIRSIDASKQTVDAIADHLLRSIKESNTK